MHKWNKLQKWSEKIKNTPKVPKADFIFVSSTNWRAGTEMDGPRARGDYFLLLLLFRARLLFQVSMSFMFLLCSSCPVGCRLMRLLSYLHGVLMNRMLSFSSLTDCDHRRLMPYRPCGSHLQRWVPAVLFCCFVDGCALFCCSAVIAVLPAYYTEH